MNFKRADGTTLPAICFDDCNTAAALAPGPGKPEELCADVTAFKSYLAQCQTCIRDFEDSSSQEQAYIKSLFAPFIDYCAQSGEAVPSISDQIASTKPPFEPTVKGTATTLTGPATIRLSHTFTLSGSVTTEVSELVFEPPALPSQPPGTSQETGPVSSATPLNDNEGARRSSRAWIAGPVIGGLAFVAVLVIAWLIMHRRNRRRQKLLAVDHANATDITMEKAQLHSDCIPQPRPQEMECPAASSELESNFPPQELPGDFSYHKTTS